jgi:hypothetical protein
MRKRNDKINAQIFKLKKAIAAAQRQTKAKLQAAARKCNGKCERSEQQGGVFIGPKGIPASKTRTTIVIGNHEDNKKRYTAVKTKGLNWDKKVLKRTARHLKDLDKVYSDVKAMHRSKYYKYPVYEPPRKGKLKFPKMLMKRDRQRLARLKAAALKAAKLKAKQAKLRISGKGGRMPGVKYGPKPAAKGGKKKKKGGLLKRLVRAVKKGAKKLGKGIKKGAKKLGKGLKKAGKGIKKGLKKLGKGIKKGGKKVGRGLGKIVRAVKKALKAVKRAIVGRKRHQPQPQPKPQRQAQPRPQPQPRQSGGFQLSGSAKIGGLSIKGNLKLH